MKLEPIVIGALVVLGASLRRMWKERVRAKKVMTISSTDICRAMVKENQTICSRK